MKNAIQKAIEGGYEKERYYFDENGNWDYVEDLYLLDPLFWQCLGKAMGWKDEVCGRCGGYLQENKSVVNNARLCGENSDCWDSGLTIETYKYHWHNFIDHIADGGTPDDFFNNLINK